VGSLSVGWFEAQSPKKPGIVVGFIGWMHITAIYKSSNNLTLLCVSIFFILDNIEALQSYQKHLPESEPLLIKDSSLSFG
jgi:hypothetical protein